MQRFFLSIVILLAIILSGCSVGDFIGAYFNTYYNARRTFSEAEKEVLTPIAGSTASKNDKPFLAPFDVPSQTKAKFTSVIEKCSKLLQYHPDSKLVDDALLMIGKSYYYQNEHQSAERKFKELINSYPESGLVPETKLLLANTYYRNNEKITAAITGREVLEEARKEGDDDIIARSANLLAHLEFENKEYDEALKYYQIAADLSETSEERATAYRSIAAIRVQQGKFKDAASAFLKSKEVSSDYVGIYRGILGEARTLSKTGNSEESLSLLEVLSKDANYREFLGEINLEIGNVYRDEHDFAAAESQYRYVDTAYARTEFAANSYYQLGLLYESEMKYDSAKVAYNKGRAEFPQAEIEPEIIKRGDAINKYVLYRDDISKNDSIRNQILHPDTNKVVEVNPDTTKHDSSKTLARLDSAAHRAPPVALPPLDSVQAHLAFAKSELAGLFYTNLSVLDSAKFWYLQILSDHPNSSYAPRALYTLAQIYGQDSTAPAGRIDSLRHEIVVRFPRSEFAVEARRHLGLPEPVSEIDPREAAYKRAEELLKSGDLKSALDSLNALAANDTTSPYAAKAQFAIGWIYENMKLNRDSSLVHYRKLVRRFPSSRYAYSVQPKIVEAEAFFQQKINAAKKDTAVVPPAVHPKMKEDFKIPGDLNNKPPAPTEVRKDSSAVRTVPPDQPKKVEEEKPKP